MTKGIVVREGGVSDVAHQKLEEAVNLYLSQPKAFVITKAMEIFLDTEDESAKLQALELLSGIDL